MRKLTIITFLCLFASSTLLFARMPESVRSPATDKATLDLSEEDLEIQKSIQYVLNIFCKYAYRLEARASEGAVEFHLYYHPSDANNVIGYASNRARALRTLLNEMSISLEEKKAIRERRPFKIEDRKLVFIRFIKEQVD